MSSDQGTAIVDLVRQIKMAIRNAEDRDPDKLLAVRRVDLELRTTFKKAAGLDGKFSWVPVPVELSLQYARSEVQTISLSLVPAEGPVLMASVADELCEAVSAVRKGVEEAAGTPPEFSLKEACIALNIGISREGKVQIIAEGGGVSENTHTVKLILAPPDDA